MRGHRHGSWLAVVALVACVACTGQEEPPEEPTASSPAEAPATSTPASAASPASASPSDTAAAEQAVLAAYLGYWDTYGAANEDPPRADYLDLERYATGEALETIRNSTFTFRENRQVFRGAPDTIDEHRVEVLEISGERATVRDCYSDGGWIEDLDTGERSNEGVGTQQSTAELVLEGETWKVSFTRLEQSWEGIAGCATE